MERGQISVEYLIVVSFIIFVVIGFLAISIFYAATIRDKIKSNQLTTYANKVVASAETVYFQGEPSQTTVTAYLPQGVIWQNVQENNGEYYLVFNFTTNSGTSRLAFLSDVPMENVTALSTNEGLKRFKIKAELDRVTISEGWFQREDNLLLNS